MPSPREIFPTRQGRDACIHYLGNGDKWSLDQLPRPGDFHRHYLKGMPGYYAGCALAESFFKLLRPAPEPEGVEIEALDQLQDYLSNFKGEMIQLGFLRHVETLLRLSLMCPDRLPEVCKRLDALDNAALSENLANALYGKPVESLSTANQPYHYGEDGGLFAGLLQGNAAGGGVL